MTLHTRTEAFRSVMSKVKKYTPGRRVSRRSEENTFPATTTLPILGLSPVMGWTVPRMALPIMTSPLAEGPFPPAGAWGAETV